MKSSAIDLPVRSGHCAVKEPAGSVDSNAIETSETLGTATCNLDETRCKDLIETVLKLQQKSDTVKAIEEQVPKSSNLLSECAKGLPPSPKKTALKVGTNKDDSLLTDFCR